MKTVVHTITREQTKHVSDERVEKKSLNHPTHIDRSCANKKVFEHANEEIRKTRVNNQKLRLDM